MTETRRIAVSAFGSLLVLAGLIVWSSSSFGVQFIVFGLLILLGTAFDRAYRGSASRAGDPRADWTDTGEREVDVASGEIIVVWYDSISGARTYEPQGCSPS